MPTEFKNKRITIFQSYNGRNKHGQTYSSEFMFKKLAIQYNVLFISISTSFFLFQTRQSWISLHIFCTFGVHNPLLCNRLQNLLSKSEWFDEKLMMVRDLILISC